jgi:2-keto-3-deoxy-L-rhamnonate aldolase RhmA
VDKGRIKLPENELKTRLLEGRVVLGTILNSPGDYQLLYVLSNAGVDFAFVDMEHGPAELETVCNLLLHARAANISLLIRVPDMQYPYITRLLDNGAQTLLVPHLRTPAEAEQAVELAYYHPLGRRGMAMGWTPAVGFGQVTDIPAATEHANSSLLLGVNIETKEAVGSLDQMLIPGIGFAIVGYADLAQTYGIPGQYQDRLIVDAKKAVSELCRSRGIYYLEVARTPDQFSALTDQGAQMILYGGVHAFAAAAADSAVQALQKLRRG